MTLIPDQIPIRLRIHPGLRRWHELLREHGVSERLCRRRGHEVGAEQLLVLVLSKLHNEWGGLLHGTGRLTAGTSP